MTRRDRIARRIERREEWAESARRESDARLNAARVVADGIPLGQPILVGHHSERRHRRDLERIDSNMRVGVERGKMAERHDAVAGELQHQLNRSIYSDDSDALEQLRARIEERERECARIKELNAKIRKEYKAGLQPGWLDRVGATGKEARAIESNVAHGWAKTPMFPGYVLSNLRGRINADKERLKAVERQQARQREAEGSAGGVVVKRHQQANWCVVTFAEKPAREVLDELRAAGYRWGAGSWHGYLDKLPERWRDEGQEQDPAQEQDQAPSGPVVCRACGEPADDGEGWDGLCGNCADKAQESEDRE